MSPKLAATTPFTPPSATTTISYRYSSGTLDTRFGTTGSLDNTFGSNGTQTANVGGIIQSMRLAADGKIVVAGYQSNDFEVARFDTAGILDTVFNGTGKLTTNLGGVDQAYALTIGPDYKITVVGASGSDFGIARYKVSSSLEERLYVLTDNNHNFTAITDVFGNVKERFIYDPYGTPTVLTSAWNSTSDSYAWAILFQGKRFDIPGAKDADVINSIQKLSLDPAYQTFGKGGKVCSTAAGDALLDSTPSNQVVNAVTMFLCRPGTPNPNNLRDELQNIPGAKTTTFPGVAGGKKSGGSSWRSTT